MVQNKNTKFNIDSSALESRIKLLFHPLLEFMKLGIDFLVRVSK